MPVVRPVHSVVVAGAKLLYQPFASYPRVLQGARQGIMGGLTVCICACVYACACMCACVCVRVYAFGPCPSVSFLVWKCSLATFACVLILYPDFDVYSLPQTTTVEFCNVTTALLFATQRALEAAQGAPCGRCC